MAVQKELSQGRLTLDRREKLTLTGAREVVRFDEDLVELNTDLGALTVEGTDLKLKCLSLDDGMVIVEGTIRTISYDVPRPRRGLWK